MLTGRFLCTEVKGKTILPLALSTKWLALAQAHEPLVLKNVLIQNQLIPVSQIAEVLTQALIHACRI